MTLYDVLQVSETASPEIIRAAYLALAKKYHPDMNRDNAEAAAERMKTVNAAYAILSDTTKRNQYDLYLRTQRRQQEENIHQAQKQTQNPRTDPNPEPPHQTEQKSQTPPPAQNAASSWKKPLIVLFLMLITPMLIYYIGNAWATAYMTNQTTFTPTTTQSVSTNNQKNNADTIETTPALQPLTEPKSGTILSGYEPYNASQITVTASHTSSCLVKLKDRYDDEVMSFYVRAGETATVDVPLETMQVYFASGTTWYGINHLFGEDTYYSKDDTSLDFANYSWEYTLYPVTDGNFTQTTIDAEEFG